MVRVFCICSSCNKEFEMTHSTWHTHTFENCSHCGERNDVWIQLRTHDKDHRYYYDDQWVRGSTPTP